MVPFHEFLSKNPDVNFKNFEKIRFIREPMERLVSAFHRILDTADISQANYERYTRPILNKIRYNGTNMMPIDGKAAWKMVGIKKLLKYIT